LPLGSRRALSHRRNHAASQVDRARYLEDDVDGVQDDLGKIRTASAALLDRSFALKGFVPKLSDRVEDVFLGSK
jgi:hypothetical protein